MNRLKLYNRIKTRIGRSAIHTIALLGLTVFIYSLTLESSQDTQNFLVISISLFATSFSLFKVYFEETMGICIKETIFTIASFIILIFLYAIQSIFIIKNNSIINLANNTINQINSLDTDPFTNTVILIGIAYISYFILICIFSELVSDIMKSEALTLAKLNLEAIMKELDEIKILIDENRETKDLKNLKKIQELLKINTENIEKYKTYTLKLESEGLISKK